MANRKSGSQDSMTGASRSPSRLGADALLEDQHEDAVGGPDRQQVQDDRLQRHHDRAEDHEQQQEAEAEHEGEHERQVVLLRLDGIDASPPSGRRRGPVGLIAVEGGRDVVVAQALERGSGLSAREVARHRPRSAAPGRRPRSISSFDAPKNSSASSEAVRSAIASWTAGSLDIRRVDHDVRRQDAVRELVVDDVEGVARVAVLRKRADADAAEVHAEDRDGRGDQEQRAR